MFSLQHEGRRPAGASPKNTQSRGEQGAVLGLDHVPGGVAAIGDNIIFDIVAGESAGGFGHPTCNGPGDVDGNADADDVEDNDTVVAAHPLN